MFVGGAMKRPFFIRTAEAQRAQRGELRENDATDAVFEDADFKVDEKGEGVTGHFEVRENLGFMDRG